MFFEQFSQKSGSENRLQVEPKDWVAEQISYEFSAARGMAGYAPGMFKSGSGTRFFVLKGPVAYESPVDWTARFVHTKGGPDDGLTHEAIFTISVMDAKIEHLAEMEAGKTCSFEKSWEGFNLQHQGHRHTSILIADYAANLIVMMNVLVLWLAYNRKKYNLSFYSILLGKFLFQDLPLQFVVATFIYGWYGQGGLRCQLCLFDPTHCSDESAINSANLPVILLSMISALCTQTILQPSDYDVMDEEEQCIWGCLRFGSLSASILPMMTVIIFCVPLALPKIAIFAISIFVAFGWLFCCCCTCIPVVAALDEGDYGGAPVSTTDIDWKSRLTAASRYSFAESGSRSMYVNV